MIALNDAVVTTRIEAVIARSYRSRSRRLARIDLGEDMTRGALLNGINKGVVAPGRAGRVHKRLILKVEKGRGQVLAVGLAKEVGLGAVGEQVVAAQVGESLATCQLRCGCGAGAPSGKGWWLTGVADHFESSGVVGRDG